MYTVLCSGYSISQVRSVSHSVISGARCPIARKRAYRMCERERACVRARRERTALRSHKKFTLLLKFPVTTARSSFASTAAAVRPSWERAAALIFPPTLSALVCGFGPSLCHPVDHYEVSITTTSSHRWPVGNPECTPRSPPPIPCSSVSAVAVAAPCLGAPGGHGFSPL